MSAQLGWAVLLALGTAFAKTADAQIATPRTRAAGFATVAEAGAWGAADNPANGPGGAGRFAAQAYGYEQLGLAGLSRYGAEAAYRLEDGGYVSVAAQAFAPPGYSAMGLHLQSGRRLADGLWAGLGLGIVSLDADEYGRRRTPVGRLGLRYRVTGSLSAGAQYAFAPEPLVPLVEHHLRVGVDYASSERVHVLLAAWQTVGAGLDGGVSLRYDAHERLRLRVGARTGGPAFSLGVEGEVASGVRLDFGLVVYQALPAGVGYGLTYAR